VGDTELLAALPVKLRQQVQRICNETGKKPVALMREAVAIYESVFHTNGLKFDIKHLTAEMRAAILSASASIRGSQTASVLTAEERRLRAVKGGIAKAKNAKARKALEAKSD